MTQNRTVVVAYGGSEAARHAIGAAARLLGSRREREAAAQSAASQSPATSPS